MAATKRRRKASTDPKLGKEVWQIIDPAGKVLRETGYGEGATLALAQTLVQKYEDPITLRVCLKPLFGAMDCFFRVVLGEDGSVSTYAQ